MATIRKGSTAGVLCLAALLTAAVGAQEKPVPPDGDPRLQTKVTLTCASEALPRLISTLGDRHGVRLSASAELQKAKVTVVVKDTPLHKLMGWLGTAYGSEWRQEEGGYVLEPKGGPEFDRRLARLGDPGWFQYGIGPATYQEQRRIAWEIHKAMPRLPELERAKGVPLADLPEESRKRLVWISQSIVSLDQLAQWRQTMPDVLSRAVVRVRPITPGQTTQPTASVLLDGQPLVDLPRPR